MTASRPLYWNGTDPIAALEAANGRGKALLHVQQTLVECDPTPQARVAYGRLEDGRTVVVTTSTAANRLRVEPARCLESAVDASGSDLLLPLVAEILGGLDRADLDLGWIAVVAGGGLRAELLLRLVQQAGAACVVSVRSEAAASPPRADHCFHGEPVQVGAPLGELLAGLRRPVVACDTTAQPAWQQSLLAAVPAESVLVLLGATGTAAGGTRVNVYRDVHRKNVRIVGAPPHPDKHLVERARRLLSFNRLETTSLAMPVHAVGYGDKPSIVPGGWAILSWRDR